jgi:hypothetical protein
MKPMLAEVFLETAYPGKTIRPCSFPRPLQYTSICWMENPRYQEIVGPFRINMQARTGEKNRCSGRL